MKKKSKASRFHKGESHPMWVDYYHLLSDTEKSFLFYFAGEVHLGQFMEKPLHSKKSIKELLNNRNARRRDVLSVSEKEASALPTRRGRYTEKDYSGGESSLCPEDALIEYIDSKKAV